MADGRPRRWPSRAASALTVLAMSVAIVSFVPTPASAHASLVATTPEDRAALDEGPGTVTLEFSEPVSVPTDGVRVFDADATRVDDGSIDVGGSESVGVALPAGLPDGGYVVTWRIQSADSHPIGGVFTFTIGDAQVVDDSVVAELFAGGSATVRILGPALRGVMYAATLLAGGAVFAGVLITRRRDDRDRADRLSARAAVVGIAATVLAVPVQVAAVSGGSILAALRPSLLGQVMTSSFGQGTVVRTVWLVVLVVFASRRAPVASTVFAAVAAVGSFVLDGHQRSVEPLWLLMTSDVVHLAAGALWLGGLVVLAVLVRSPSIDDDPIGAARLVSRFSDVALVTVAAVGLTGLAMSWALVRSPRALVSTTYGWTLSAKVGLVVLVVLVALYNRRRLVPAVAARAAPAGGSGDDGPIRAGTTVGDSMSAPEGVEAPEEGAGGPGDRVARRSRAAWRQLRSTLVVEVVVLVAVLGVTSALVTIQPAAQAAGVTGAYQTVTPLTDELDVELIVDPNRVGLNAIHLYVLDATGRPAEGVDDLYLELTYVPEDIGPLRIEPFFAGAGHWTTNTDDLTFDGEWRVEVIAGLDRFTEARADVTVFVQP